ncbi:dihydrodipicolinate synthase family protein [Brachybacterium sp. Z12]|uniref:dihydrodipicolinate synthase family protein n=1 Tax=Brachybacterium sp. Z12 TaxID=2759167 RepID=UPI00185F621F|nr:dihydrodipicolinate synthase family protein [Brachybacterium sp. Z12]QNN82530.1 dihydrodipicolinate synthase family protein [Brachybacterium sp. Z12]
MTISGILPALLTAYDDEGSISLDRTSMLVSKLVDTGVDGFFVSGTSGEYYLLSTAERLELLETVAAHAGDRHVVMQVAASDQRDVREMARRAADHGATAISASIPLYYTYSDESLVDYFRDIRSCSELPLIGYTIPGFTGRVLSADLLTGLAAEGTLAGLKYTSSDLAVLARVRAGTPEGFSLLLGSDDLLVAALSHGADGGIGATFNIAPRLYVDLHRAFREGDLAEARRLQELAVALLGALAQGEVYPTLKSGMRARGVDIGQSRAPMAQHTPEQDAQVAGALAAVDGLEGYLIS